MDNSASVTVVMSGSTGRSLSSVILVSRITVLVSRTPRS